MSRRGIAALASSLPQLTALTLLDVSGTLHTTPADARTQLPHILLINAASHAPAGNRRDWLSEPRAAGDDAEEEEEGDDAEVVDEVSAVASLAASLAGLRELESLNISGECARLSCCCCCAAAPPAALLVRAACWGKCKRNMLCMPIRC